MHEKTMRRGQEPEQRVIKLCCLRHWQRLELGEKGRKGKRDTGFLFLFFFFFFFFFSGRKFWAVKWPCQMAWPNSPPTNKVERGKSSGESRAQPNSYHNHRFAPSCKKLVRVRYSERHENDSGPGPVRTINSGELAGFVLQFLISDSSLPPSRRMLGSAAYGLRLTVCEGRVVGV